MTYWIHASHRTRLMVANAPDSLIAYLREQGYTEVDADAYRALGGRPNP